MDELSIIEESNEGIETLVEKCNNLKNSYFNCTSQKDSILARIIHRLGSFYFQKTDFQTAIELSEEAVAINKQKHSATERSYLANTYFNLGVFYNYLNAFSTSIIYYDSVILIANEYPEKEFLKLRAFQQIAYSYFQLGDYQKSIDVSQNGILLAEGSEDALFEAILLTQKAQSQIHLNRLDPAEKNLRRGFDILKKLGVKDEYLASIYNVYALLNVRKKNFEEAIFNYEESYLINQSINNFSQCTRDLLDLGLLYDRDLKKPNKALEAYQRGIEIIESENDPYLKLVLYTNMGVVYWRQKDFDAALRYYQKALNNLPINFKDTLIEINPTEAHLKLVSNNYYVFQVLANKAQSQLERYKKGQKAEHLVQALETFRLADIMVDQMRQKQVKEVSKSYWRETTKKVYNYAIETCYLLNDTENAFYFFEKSRAVLLNDQLNELNAKSFLSKEDLIKEQSLLLRISSLQLTLGTYKDDTPELKTHQEELFHYQDQLEKYIKSLEQTNPTYFQYKYSNNVLTIEEVRNKILKENKTLVEYFNFDDHLYTLTIDPENAKIDRLSIENLDSLTQELNVLCSNKALLNQNYSRFSELSHLLYNYLFKPLGITTRKVIISNDALFVPFEALLSDPDQPTSFLVKDHIFSYTYSASFLLNSNKKTLPEIPNLLGIAPEEFHPDLKKSPLLGAGVSLNKIKPYFQNSEFLIKEAATKNQFLQKLPAYSVVQLYSHAEADTSGNASFLFFYDSVLHLNELQNLTNIKTGLIILSACKTGIGKLVKGEGVFSISRSFAAAGIPSTISNLWDIDNHSTYLLTELFYRFVNDGYHYDEALQKAKIEFLLSSDKEQQLPYYWASSILVGPTDAHNYKKKNNRYQLIITALSFIVLIFFMLFLFKHIKKRPWGNS